MLLKGTMRASTPPLLQYLLLFYETDCETVEAQNKGSSSNPTFSNTAAKSTTKIILF